MINKKFNDVLEFIAYELEGKGAPDQPTLYGVTKHYYPNYYREIEACLDNKQLLKETILKIYRLLFQQSDAKFFEPPLSYLFFDHFINAGKHSAVWLWQTTYNQVQQIKTITVDGIWGEQTTRSALHSRGYTMIFYPVYLSNRVKYYNNTSSKYKEGWINRVVRLNEFLFAGSVSD